MKNYNQGSRSGGGNKFRGGHSGGGRDGARPAMHPAICDNCGNSCEVPFKPTGEKPIYCNNCFADMRGDSEGGNFNRSEPRRFERSSSASSSSSFGGDRQLFSAVCDNCGDDCKVPFRPSGGKPVYCSNCFEKNGDSRGGDFSSKRTDYNSRGNSNRDSAPRSGGNDNRQLTEQMNALNSKLDRILRALEAKVVAAPAPVAAKKEKEVVMPVEAKSSVGSKEIAAAVVAETKKSMPKKEKVVAVKAEKKPAAKKVPAKKAAAKK